MVSPTTPTIVSGPVSGVVLRLPIGSSFGNTVRANVSLTTVVGAVYLVAVSLIPEALVAYGGLPHFFGGGSALIVVCTILDVETQVRGISLTKPGGEYS